MMTWAVLLISMFGTIVCVGRSHYLMGTNDVDHAGWSLLSGCLFLLLGWLAFVMLGGFQQW
jgi:hypothetical protein